MSVIVCYGCRKQVMPDRTMERVLMLAAVLMLLLWVPLCPAQADKPLPLGVTSGTTYKNDGLGFGLRLPQVFDLQTPSCASPVTKNRKSDASRICPLLTATGHDETLTVLVFDPPLRVDDSNIDKLASETARWMRFAPIPAKLVDRVTSFQAGPRRVVQATLKVKSPGNAFFWRLYGIASRGKVVVFAFATADEHRLPALHSIFLEGFSAAETPSR